MVRVTCMTFDQASYITDALNGFVMQKTKFPFVCIIVDDASTDGEQDVIRKYVGENFDLQEASIAYDKDTDYGHVTYARHKTNKNCFFAVVYLNENHYGQKKAKSPYLTEWLDAKYVAICEGDDYWTDPLKLQKQVRFLEENDNVDLCCTDTMVLTPDGSFHHWPQYQDSRIATVEDIILFGLGGKGVYFQTATFVLRKSLLLGKEYPSYCKECHVSDYPMLLWAALNGGVYYMNVVTSTYRLQSQGSWTQREKKVPVERQLKGWRSEVNMLKGLDEWSNGKYSSAFKERIGDFLYSKVKGHEKEARLIAKEFSSEMHLLTFKQRVYVRIAVLFPRLFPALRKMRSKRMKN